MPIENNIELGHGQIYFKGLDESVPLNISNVELDGDIEWADDKEYIKINTPTGFTLTCDDLQISREWTLAYCRVCRQPIPITQFDALTLGTEGWTCPLCTMIVRMRRRVPRDCCSEV